MIPILWMVKSINAKPKNRLIKLRSAILVMLLTMLSTQFETGQARFPNQTIPTAPPPTVEIPTLSPSSTPGNTPQTTPISTQPSDILASQTSITSASPSTIPTRTDGTSGGTIPTIPVSQTPTMVVQISPTSPYQPTSVVPGTPGSKISSGLLYCLFGGVALILFVIGIVWFLKTRNSKRNWAYFCPIQIYWDLQTEVGR